LSHTEASGFTLAYLMTFDPVCYVSDTAAKAGLAVAISNMRFPVSDLLACANQLRVKE